MKWSPARELGAREIAKGKVQEQTEVVRTNLEASPSREPPVRKANRTRLVGRDSLGPLASNRVSRVCTNSELADSWRLEEVEGIYCVAQLFVAIGYWVLATDTTSLEPSKPLP